MAKEYSKKNLPTMRDILEDVMLRNVFTEFMEQELAVENFLFFLDAENYKKCTDQRERSEMFHYIYDR